MTFRTGEHLLFDNPKLESSETILIQASRSGIGTAAIQLAKRMCCIVITTAGLINNMEKTRLLGGDLIIIIIIIQREKLFEGAVQNMTRKKGVDVVFDNVGAGTWAGFMLSLWRGGRLLACGFTSGCVGANQPHADFFFSSSFALPAPPAARCETWLTPWKRGSTGWPRPRLTRRSASRALMPCSGA